MVGNLEEDDMINMTSERESGELTSGVDRIGRAAAVESVDGGDRRREPAEEVAGAGAVDVRRALHGLEGERADEGQRVGGAER